MTTARTYSGTKTKVKTNFDTSDIINVVVDVCERHWKDAEAFAKKLQGKNRIETCKNVFVDLITDKIYQLDPTDAAGKTEQIIQRPKTFHIDKVGDCKTFAVYTYSILKCLGIQSYLKFVGLEKNGSYTHVYVIVPLVGNKYITIDGTPRVDFFGNVTEKRTIEHFNHEYDHKISKVINIENSKNNKKMSGLFTIEGQREADYHKPGILDIGDPLTASEGLFDIAIAKQRLEIEKSIVDEMRGIGSVKSEHYQDAIDAMDDVLYALKSKQPELISGIIEEMESGNYSIAGKISGIADVQSRAKERLAIRSQRIGSLKSKAAELKSNIKQAANKAATAVKTATTKAGNFVENAAAKVGPAIKTAVKAVSEPQKLVLKGLIEILLPQSSMFFLYLFIPATAAAKLGSKAKTKLQKQLNIKKFIVEKLGMKEEHFLGIIRNGIMKRSGKQPETLIAEMMKNGKVSGIGVVPIAAIGPVIEIIQKLIAIFGKKDAPEVTSDSAPDPANDFNDMPDDSKKEAANETRSNTSHEDPDKAASDDSTLPQDKPQDNRKSSGWCS